MISVGTRSWKLRHGEKALSQEFQLSVSMGIPQSVSVSYYKPWI